MWYVALYVVKQKVCVDPLRSLRVIITNYQTGCTVVFSHFCQVKSSIPLGADFKKVS